MMTNPFFENENVSISLENALIQHLGNGVYQTQLMADVYFDCIDCMIRTKKNRFETGFFKDMEANVSLVFEFTLHYDNTKSSSYYIDDILLKDFNINSLPNIPVWYDMALTEDNSDRIYDATVNFVRKNPKCMDWILRERLNINYK